MKKLLTFAAAGVAIMLFLAPTAFAAEFIAPDKDSGNITLSNGETHKNVYIAGGSIFINSNIAGDLYGAGGTIIVEGNVEQDVVIAGGTVTINGQVGGDIRVAGGNIIINGAVAGDVIMGGGTLHLTEKANVTGDLVAGAGEITVDATVVGNLKIAGGVVTLNSSLPGKIDVMADQSFIIGSKAIIANDINYKGNTEAVVQDGAQVKAVNFEKLPEHRGGQVGAMFAALFTIAFVIKAIGLVLAGLLLMKLFPRTAASTVRSMNYKPWSNAGIGLLALIVGPILIVILLITFIGFYIAFLIFFVWLIMLLLAALVASVHVGAWIVKMLTKKTEMVYDWQALLIGVVVLGIIMIVPFIGGLVFFVLLMMAFGGIIRQFYGQIKNEQSFNEPQVIN